ncbi:hypothetical protein IS481_12145 [Caldimonas thermodepolymerans]|uniref:hypothetical protein n=1 Tax=Caldimonas thermodepolymerans TaxID=215580 RepID=UPI000E0A296F|nr:hypothetical protein [Caldimonas thermodepolymerans]QPC30521.1 hypothetical protein IS481_12145 [Caldimonas thermodepolymerans]
MSHLVNPAVLKPAEFDAWGVRGVSRDGHVLYQPHHTENGSLGPVYRTAAQAAAAILTRRATGRWERNLAFGPVEEPPPYQDDGRTPNLGALEGAEYAEA